MLNSNIGWAKDFSYSKIVISNDFRQNSGIKNINSQTNMIRVLFWYSGTSDPQFGYLNFYRNIPGRDIQILHYYDGTYNAKVTVDVDWKNNIYNVFSIILPNEYWYVAVQEWM